MFSPLNILIYSPNWCILHIWAFGGCKSSTACLTYKKKGSRCIYNFSRLVHNLFLCECRESLLRFLLMTTKGSLVVCNYNPMNQVLHGSPLFFELCFTFALLSPQSFYWGAYQFLCFCLVS